jgi:pimeloyl-ACP methyl ester carboxylesterase/DNA-binding CsgD family transcriptional regulator
MAPSPMANTKQKNAPAWTGWLRNPTPDFIGGKGLPFRTSLSREMFLTRPDLSWVGSLAPRVQIVKPFDSTSRSIPRDSIRDVDRPNIRHATTEDGARVAFWTQGRGTPLIYIGVPCCSHVQLELDLPVFMDWYAQLSGDYQLVRMDLRGYGASQREDVQIGVEEFKRDIRAVADALNLYRFAIFTQGGSGPAAMSLAAESVRVEKLIICDGWADGPNLAVHQRVGAAQALADADYTMFSEVMAKVVLGAPDAVSGRIAQLLRQSAGADTWRAFSALMRQLDVSDCLRKIDCPALIIHSGPSPLVGEGEASLAIAGAIRGARLATFSSRNFPLGRTADILKAIKGFLGGGAAGRPAPDAALLSRREREVLELLARGKTNQQIADELVITLTTAARHVHNLLTKMGFSNRAEAGTWAAARRPD